MNLCEKIELLQTGGIHCPGIDNPIAVGRSVWMPNGYLYLKEHASEWLVISTPQKKEAFLSLRSMDVISAMTVSKETGDILNVGVTSGTRWVQGYDISMCLPQSDSEHNIAKRIKEQISTAISFAVQRRQSASYFPKPY
jgi:hypothetical protein